MIMTLLHYKCRVTMPLTLKMKISQHLHYLMHISLNKKVGLSKLSMSNALYKCSTCYKPID